MLGGCLTPFLGDRNTMLNQFEIGILDWIQTLRNPVLDVFMPLITKLGDGGIFWIAVTLLFLILPKTRKTGCFMMFALLFDVVLCNVMIKPLVDRTRPFVVNPDIMLLITKPHEASFPSGHTAVSFTSAFALYFAGQKKLFCGAVVLAILIALSRLYLYVHYPTDIIGGAVLGIICAYLGALVARRILNKKETIH